MDYLDSQILLTECQLQVIGMQEELRSLSVFLDLLKKEAEVNAKLGLLGVVDE